MSPGPTFERVYLALKRQLREGTRPPGAALEPTAIGDELGTSFTPVRDALHRLVGEGLVENPLHNGFAVPRPSEQALRDLYAWNGEVLALITARQPQRSFAITDIGSTPDIPAAAEALFRAFAEQSGNREHARIVGQLNDRLAPFRQVEPQCLPDAADELEMLQAVAKEARKSDLAQALSRYHRRRIELAPDLLIKRQELSCWPNAV